MTNEEKLEPTTRALFDIARSAELGFEGQKIRGAIVILQYEKSSKHQVVGDIIAGDVFSSCMQVILDSWASVKQMEAIKEMEKAAAMFDKTKKDNSH